MELCKLRLGHLTDMLTKSLVMRYSLTEDAGFYDAHEMAISANSSNGAGVEAVYHALFEMPAVLLASLVYVGLIGFFSLLLCCCTWQRYSGPAGKRMHSATA